MTNKGWRWKSFQESIIEEVIAGGGVGLIPTGLGSGKTAMGTEIVHRATEGNLTGPVIIVAPLNTFGGWIRHIEMLTGETLRIMASTKAGKEAETDALNGVPGYYAINWERNRRHDWSKVNLNAVIVDETHRMQNRKASQSKAVHSMKHAPIKVAMSGTPAGNKIEGIWSTLHFLWPSKFKFYWPWINTYMVKRKDPFAGMVIVGEKYPGQVAKSIPVFTKRTAEEIQSELPDVVVHDIPVALAPAQRRIYTQFEKDALAWLDNNPVAAALPITKMIRMRQVCLAVPSVNEDDEVTFAVGAKSSKLDAMMDILTDLPEGEKVLVWTHSKRIIPVVMDRLAKGGYEAVAIHGGQSKTERDNNLASFKAEDQAQVLVATIPALGEGTDGLQNVCAVEVWLSQDDSVMLNKQAGGRLNRPGQTKVVNRYVIRAENTLETRQIGRLKSVEGTLLAGNMI